MWCRHAPKALCCASGISVECASALERACFEVICDLKGSNRADLYAAFARLHPRGVPPQLGQRLDCDQARMSLTGKYRRSLNRPHCLAAQLGYTRPVVTLPDVRNSQIEYRAGSPQCAQVADARRRRSAARCLVTLIMQRKNAGTLSCHH
jgi:hypothetical protein